MRIIEPEIMAADVRLECLKLAQASSGNAADIVDRAKAYADFVLGRADIALPGTSSSNGSA